MELCARNKTSASAACVGAQADALHSAAGNGSWETGNVSFGNSSLLASQGGRQKGEHQTVRATIEGAPQRCSSCFERVFVIVIKFGSVLDHINADYVGGTQSPQPQLDHVRQVIIDIEMV